MELTLILGPMKSGKSADLIEFFSALDPEKISYGLYQPVQNVRDEKIRSRNGQEMDAEKVETLAAVIGKKYDIIGVDEIHMFPADESAIIERILVQNTRVVVAGLMVDYRGRIFDIVKDLMELGPKEIRHKTTACEKCRQADAFYTQVLKDSIPMTSGLPLSVADDGTYNYLPVCRQCFVKV